MSHVQKKKRESEAVMERWKDDPRHHIGECTALLLWKPFIAPGASAEGLCGGRMNGSEQPPDDMAEWIKRTKNNPHDVRG